MGRDLRSRSSHNRLIQDSVYAAMDVKEATATITTPHSDGVGGGGGGEEEEEEELIGSGKGKGRMDVRRRRASEAVDVSERATVRWERAELSVARTYAAAAGCGDVIVIAGGTLPGKSNAKGMASVDERVARAKPETERALRNLLVGGKSKPTDVVDVYNASIGVWSTARLSSPRTGAVATATSDHIFIAGGEDASGEPSATVDVFHVGGGGGSGGGRGGGGGGGGGGEVGSWSQIRMSTPRRNFAAAAAVWPGGDLVLFAGGAMVGSGTGGSLSRTVDVYDARAGQWMPGGGQLSRARKKLTGIGVGSKVLFAGGQEPTDNDGEFSTRVDIYDGETNRWSRGTLSQGRMYVAAASAGGKAFFAGGNLGGAWEQGAWVAGGVVWGGMLVVVSLGNHLTQSCVMSLLRSTV